MTNLTINNKALNLLFLKKKKFSVTKLLIFKSSYFYQNKEKKKFR